MFKKFSVLMAVIMIASMLLAACGGGAPSEADCADSEVVCIGLVTDVGEIDDKSFNQSAWEGAQQAAEELDGIANYIETKDAKDYAANMQLFIDKAYDYIVTVGFAMGTATVEAAKANPNVKFVGVDQGQWAETVPNVIGLIFHEDQSGFLAGALAAQMTKTGTIAAVLGTDLIPPVVAFKEGYEAGARYINPNINIISTYHPGGLDVAFTDPEWGGTTAAQALQNGADVIFGAGGKTGNGALEETAKNAGMYCIGVDTDQWDTVPAAHPCLMSSAMKLIIPGLVDILTGAEAGTWTAGNYYGAAGLAPYHDFDSKIPQEVKDKITEIDAGLKDGSITTGYTG